MRLCSILVVSMIFCASSWRYMQCANEQYQKKCRSATQFQTRPPGQRGGLSSLQERAKGYRRILWVCTLVRLFRVSHSYIGVQGVNVICLDRQHKLIILCDFTFPLHGKKGRPPATNRPTHNTSGFILKSRAVITGPCSCREWSHTKTSGLSCGRTPDLYNRRGAKYEGLCRNTGRKGFSAFAGGHQRRSGGRFFKQQPIHRLRHIATRNPPFRLYRYNEHRRWGTCNGFHKIISCDSPHYHCRDCSPRTRRTYRCSAGRRSASTVFRR
jgi:hypothetical protein